MKKILSSLVVLLSISLASASNGDTTYIKAFDKYHMGAYGNHDIRIKSPTPSFKSQRIWMKYTIGCTSGGQCEWDYTVKLNVRQHTGKKDSTLKQAPSFKVVNGAAKDTIVYYSTDTTYTNIFNSTTKQTDSVKTNLVKIAMFRDTLNPLVCTDTIVAWPTNFYRYNFDTTGKKIDSVLVPVQLILHVKYTPYYSVFEIINDIEMGRMISPYAKNFPKNFQYEHWYDVTDFASLLHDSTDIRIKFEGYSFGFTSTIEFYFVEGTPAREATGLDIIYNGYYNYGQGTSIEASLNSKKFKMPADVVSAKLRLLITGHGGESNENCAEFCAKNYYLKLNDKLIATQLVWKDDCGSNAIINQGGTWIYDRANWCPGEKIKLYEYPLAITPGSDDSIDIDMDPFIANGGAGYNIAAYVIYYKANTRTLDAGIEDILAPSKNFWYSKFNPVCDNSLIVLKNWGSQTLTSAEISYQMGNASARKINWYGSLGMTEEAQVTLPNYQWPSDLTKNTFKAWISKLNNQEVVNDENAYNNSMTSQTDIPQAISPDFIIETTTNTKPENSYTIKDAYGNVVASRSFTKLSVVNRDTFHLGLGCYTFELIDSGKNGLSFWANNDGAGSIRFKTANAPVTVIKTFNPDFGNYLKFNFTILYKVGINELSSQLLEQTKVYPSPASDLLNIETSSELRTIELYDLSSRLVYKTDRFEKAIHISEFVSGVYFLRLSDVSGNEVFRKIVISR